MISFLVIMDNEDICVGQGSAESARVLEFHLGQDRQSIAQEPSPFNQDKQIQQLASGAKSHAGVYASG